MSVFHALREPEGAALGSDVQVEDGAEVSPARGRRQGRASQAVGL